MRASKYSLLVCVSLLGVFAVTQNAYQPPKTNEQKVRIFNREGARIQKLIDSKKYSAAALDAMTTQKTLLDNAISRKVLADSCAALLTADPSLRTGIFNFFKDKDPSQPAPLFCLIQDGKVRRQLNMLEYHSVIKQSVKWITAKDLELPRQTCARANMKPAKDQGNGTCASKKRDPASSGGGTRAEIYGWVKHAYCYDEAPDFHLLASDIVTAYLCYDSEALATAKPDTSPVRVCDSASFNTAASISCPLGEKVIKVDFASYGAPTGACGSYKIGTCNSAKSRTRVESLCLGKDSCVVKANTKNFGNPCPGSKEQLKIQVQCGI